MGNAVVEILPLALSVALSPVGIIALILMLLSPKATSNGLAFLAGWVVGISLVSIATTIFSGITDLGSGGGGESSTAISILGIALGLALLGLAIRTFRRRPGPGEQPPLPVWLRAMDSVTPVRAFGIAFLLSSVQPKNLALTAAAAVTVAREGLSLGSATLTLVVFTVVSSLTIAIPVIFYFAGGVSARTALDRVRGWMYANTATVTAFLFLAIGVVLLRNNVGGLLG